MYYTTSQEMARLDARAVKSGLEITQMMELAGWHMVQVFSALQISRAAGVVVVCGKGNKAGDGLCAARHLINHGWFVVVVLLTGERELSLDARHHLKLLKKMETSIVPYARRKQHAQKEIARADIIIDALIGYRLNGAPRGVFAKVIEEINQSRVLVIAYDMPTGINATTGECHTPCIKAAATLTLAAPKRLFRKKQAQILSGKVVVGDIGIPAGIYNKIKKNSRPQFNQGLIWL